MKQLNGADLIGQPVLISVGAYQGDWGVVRGYDSHLDQYTVKIGDELVVYQRDQIRTEADVYAPDQDAL